MGWQDAPVEGASAAPAWASAPVEGADTPIIAPKKKPGEPTSYLEGAKNLLSGVTHVALGIPRGIANAGLDLAQYSLNEDTPKGKAAIASLERGKQAVTNASEYFDTPDVHAGMNEFGQGVGNLVANGTRALHHGVNAVVGQPAGDTIADVAGDVARPALDLSAVVPAAGAVGTAVRGAREAAAARAAAASAPAETTSQVAKAMNIKIPPTLDPEAGTAARTAERISGGPGLAHDYNTHNQKVINDVALNQEAGIDVKPGVAPSTEDFAKAKAPHNQVYNKVANTIESGPSSPEFNAKVTEANGTGLFAGDDADVASKISKLTSGEPVDGQYLVNSSRELRGRGYRYENSQDPVIQDRGSAYIKLANAVDDELARRLPPGGPVSIEDLMAARKGLAKIHEVQGALVGSNVDISRIARADQKRPGVLDGGLKALADVGNDFPTVTGLISRKTEPVRGLGAHHAPALLAAGLAASGHLLSGGATTIGILGAQYGLRKALTSGAESAGVLAENPRLARFFPKAEPPAAQPPLELQPSPGRAFEPHQPQLLRPDASGVTAAESSQVPQDTVRLVPPLGQAFEPHQPGLPFGPGGPSKTAAHMAGGLELAPDTAPARHALSQSGLNLADVLSGNISLGDRLTTPELSLAPERAPTSGGVPFKAPAGFMAGGLELAPESGASPRPAPATDLASVMSSRVEPVHGHTVQENVQFSPMRDHHVIPGSTVISEGGSRADPDRFISLTPQADGTLRVTNTHVDPGSRRNGYGTKNVLDAIDLGESKGKAVTGDKTVRVEQLAVLAKAKADGLIDYDFSSPALQAKAEAMLKPGYKGSKVLKSGSDEPVTTNWRRVKGLGDKLVGE